MTEILENKKVVSIPSDLYDSVAESIKSKSFRSVDEFVTYVLRVMVGKKAQPFTEEDEESVKARLKALGYL
jgi:Arc/MetJ-type ribon-helix-helix transcriptional regulator